MTRATGDKTAAVGERVARLAAAERNQSHAPVPVRHAASLIIVDREGANGPAVLMGRRSQRHVFMPGRFVFPGGRVDPDDAAVRVAADHADAARTRLLRTEPAAHDAPPLEGPTGARALGVAALRETFEETGLFVGRRTPAPLQPDGAAWAPFRERALGLHLAPLCFLARAITPPGRPRRFDTRFFVADRGEIAAADPTRLGADAELEDIAWVPMASARELALPAITLTVLDELAARLRDDPLLEGDIGVPFYHMRGDVFARDIL